MFEQSNRVTFCFRGHPSCRLNYHSELFLRILLFPLLPVGCSIVCNSIIAINLILMSGRNHQFTRGSGKAGTGGADSRQLTVTLFAVTSMSVVLTAPSVWNAFRQAFTIYNFQV